LIEVQPEAMGFQLAQFTEIARGIDSWDVKARAHRCSAAVVPVVRKDPHASSD
jgi:hypothetical protein